MSGRAGKRSTASEAHDKQTGMPAAGHVEAGATARAESKGRAMLGRLRGDSLITNSLYLMVATGAQAFFGFIFWIVVARIFRTETVGLATTLLATSGLLSSLSLVGFDTVFIRFLPKSTTRSEQINTGLIAVGAASVVTAGIFCALIPMLSPKLAFVNHHAAYVLGFVIFTVFAAWNTLTNAVFIAYRRTRFVLIINVIFSAVKMVLPFAFMHGGAMAIFVAAGIAQVVNVALSIGAMMHYFDYKPQLRLSRSVLREIAGYSFGAYLASFFNLLPGTALPLIVTNRLGASAAAFFYIAYTIANLLFTIGYATMQSLFAEGSHDEARLRASAIKGVKMALALTTPAILIVCASAPLVLRVFGHAYAHGAIGLLRILSVSSLAVIGYSTLTVIFKVLKHVRAMIWVNLSYAATIVALSLALARPLHLPGVGWAWMAGNVVAIVIGSFFLRDPIKQIMYASKEEK